MSPDIAILVCIAVIAGLFWLNRDPKERTSKALWIPVIWVAIASSRMASEWLAVTGLRHGATLVTRAQQFTDGSPLDRRLLMGLEILALIMIVVRSKRVISLLRANMPIIIFFAYCGYSTLWSDFTDVSFKRWIKALGDLAMVLVVLSDRHPSAAVKRLLVRVGFLLIPISVLLIIYFPKIGANWSPDGLVQGVATSKNGLGEICVLFGLGSVWFFWRALRDSKSTRRTGRLIAHGVFLVMVLWLFTISSMITALACFLMGSALIVATSIRSVARKSAIVHMMVAGMVSLSVFALFFESGGSLLTDLGRNSTLTGRTELWRVLLGITGNPLVGTGFQSYWLGPRLAKIWSFFWWTPNEAHNGYLGVYLNLGLIGLALLGVLILTGYRNVIRSLRRDPEFGSLWLAYFVAAVIWNFTESSFSRMMEPMWIFFLLLVMAATRAGFSEGGPPGAGKNYDLAELESPVDEMVPADF